MPFIKKNIVAMLLGLILFSGCRTDNDYLSAGRELRASGNARAALVMFQELIQENPYLKEGYIELAQCHENLNHVDSAIQVYLRMLDIYPDNTAANYYLGICSYHQKKFKDAIFFFNKALDTKGGFNSADTTSFQAMLDLNKDNFETESAEIDIPTREILYDRGMTYYKIGQFRNARYDFNICLLQNYNISQSNYMIGMCGKSRPAKMQMQ